MSTYNVHAGHGLANGQGCGAVSILDESTEARKVRTALIKYLQTLGHTVYDCTYEANNTQNAILKAIVTKCNEHAVDLDISIHLNSGRNDQTGDDSTGGVEVYGYTSATQTVGANICSKIASTFGYTNRGFKINQSLYVLRNTNSQAILIECCFVDDVDDAKVWNPQKCAWAIAEAITGSTIATTTTSTATKTTTTEAAKTTTTTTASTSSLKYAVGTTVTVSSYYTSSTASISEAKYGTKTGTIIKTYPGTNNPYAVGSGTTVCFFCNDGDIRSTGSGATTTATTTTTKAQIIYQVYANGKWYPNVTNDSDYAGVENAPISAVALHLSDGKPITYRVHTTAGKWLGWISKHDTSDYYNGFAGDQKNSVDAVQIKCDSYQIMYKVSTTSNGTSYYAEVDDAADDYAGVFGKAIDKLVCRVV